MTHSNMPFDEFALSEIRYLVEQGKKLEAIAKYREIARVGLAEAKAAVESLSTGEATQTQGLMNEVDADVAGKVKALMQQGNKIEAIKVYREATGTGLKEAKDAVEALDADSVLPMAQQANVMGEPSEKVNALLERGNIIEAIKAYREITGAGLKEAKDAIDAIKRQRGWR
jgi:ribosomal protein L7/L12